MNEVCWKADTGAVFNLWMLISAWSLPISAYRCQWLPIVANGCLWLPMAAYGCLWLPMHRATIKKRLAEAPALAPAWRSCCGWGHLLLPAVSTGAVQQLAATGVTAPVTTPGFFKERDFPITDLLLLAVVWSLLPSCYQRSAATITKQHLVSLREDRESRFCNASFALFESMKWHKETFSVSTFFSS